jgi:lipopolysaccharide/colanic/teichoic acid biosynthesis glycosyltransferase
MCLQMITTIKSTDDSKVESSGIASLPNGSTGEVNMQEAVSAILLENGKFPSTPHAAALYLDSNWLKAFSRREESALWLGSKRAFDILGALAGMVVLGPIMLFGMFLVWLEDGGPVIFRQERVGLHGKRFPMLKIRTMVKDAESRLAEVSALNQHSDQRTFKAKVDPRVLRLGKFLRKYSIDEFPQLLNVLLGHMSLVGPRPPLTREVALYSPSDHVRFIVKPGLTCYWQISGRGEVPFEEQLKLDIKYIRERSAMTDIVIIAKTVPSLIRAKGAH